MAKIRIIDDDEESARNLATLLTQAGHTVSVRNDTDGALAELIATPPDLLVLDVMFPGNPAAGFDLARTVRQHPQVQRLPIILLTSLNRDFPMNFSAKDIDSSWMPVQDFVDKPVNVPQLLSKIRRLLKTAAT